ncbi:MAG: hypothetical protein LBH46_00720 [Rickettsiales bacterium]|jgi:hypothetical protein|nr:hypothetical protein [Rickettsiales bacterium]
MSEKKVIIYGAKKRLVDGSRAYNDGFKKIVEREKQIERIKEKNPLSPHTILMKQKAKELHEKLEKELKEIG